MTPAYECDPEQPKIVPLNQCHSEPAKQERTGKQNPLP
jgi:hypothetical protein